MFRLFLDKDDSGKMDFAGLFPTEEEALAVVAGSAEACNYTLYEGGNIVAYRVDIGATEAIKF